MKLLNLVISNFRFVSILIVLLLLNGLYSFFSMPRYEDPQIPSNGCVIRVIYPGANALEVEAQIIKPIEEALSRVTGLKNVIANAQNDIGAFYVEYEHSLRKDEKFAEVAREIDNVRQRLPDEVEHFSLEPRNISQINIYQFALVSENATYGELRARAEDLKEKLEVIPSIGLVEVRAVPSQRVVVAVDLERLAGLNIPLSRVMGVIQGSNEFIPSGTRDIGTRKFNIYTNNKFQTLNDIRSTIIQGVNGKIIYLEDIAKVYWGFEEEHYRARYNGEKAAFVTATQKPKTNIVGIEKAVSKIIEEYKEDLDPSFQLQTVFNQYESVAYRINDFFSNLIQGIILVGFVILIFVGLRPSMIVMTAVPFSILIGLGVVDASGFGMQQISIVGLVVALGLLVDNAIVVIENIVRYVELGYKIKDAVLEGAGQVGSPLISSTLTTVLAFVPIIFIPDASGDFIRSLPVTIIFTLLASLLVAMTLTPIIAQFFLKEKHLKSKNFIQKRLERFVNNQYLGILRWVLSKPFLTLSITILMFVASIGLFIHIGVGFFPKAEKPYLLVNITLPVGSNLDATDKIAKRVESILQDKDFLESYTTNIGYGNPNIYYSMSGPQRTSHQGQILLKLKSRDPDDVEEWVENLEASFKAFYGAQIDVVEFEQGPPFEAPLVFRLVGENLEKLKTISFEIDSIISAHPLTRDVENPLKVTQTDLEVHINKEKASIMGVGLDEINRAIRTGISGVPISTFNDEKGDSYDIVVKLQNDDEVTIGDIDKIYVESITGSIIPLKQMADVRFREAPVHIQHLDRQRVVTISANIKKGANLNNVASEINEKLENYKWPQGYGYKVAGLTDAQGNTFRSLGRAAVIAFICIFAILVLQFKSVIQPLIIFSALPFAIIGSVLMLFLTGNIFTFTAFVGMTSLIGIVVNDSILLVDFANQEIKEGKTVPEAIMKAGEIRFAPIILTSLTTIAGLLPLTMSGGTLWAPMGWTIIGGLMTSTILILLVVPVLYQLFTPKA